MTDIKKLEELAKIVYHNGLIKESGKREVITPNVKFYINDMSEFDDMDHAFFCFEFNGFEVYHVHSDELTIKVKSTSFDDLNLPLWFDAVEEEIKEVIKKKKEIITVNGKRYVAIEE